ncbi:polysaccharide deacetylase [Rhodoblastus sphagnicola]|uniref:polysaccharide deacetylase n=1 Tax=Rhodoblastus sphagnicola TaxID=333368 RepID=UPI001AEE5EBA|nr:polysaccharide deacetylase [Rhodoblastus sphagnicola]
MAIAFCACGAARADDCATPVRIEAPLDEPLRSLERVTDYQMMLESCTRDDTAILAIRDMKVDGEELLLTVNPETLQTRLERAACWTCREAGPDAWKSRYIRAVEEFGAATGKKLPPGASWLENAGLTHARDNRGVFVTGDLCPSHKPLERRFLQNLETQDAKIALSVTGLWVTQHGDDFRWLRKEKAEKRLDILWTNHSFTHPFRPSLPDGDTFILTKGLDPEDEIVNVERLLIANGETPSVFFRYPGLVSNSAWATRLRAAHLIPLGADSWLALGEKPGPGGVILVHPNGNEPAGIAAFERLNHSGAVPRPFRPLMEAP